MVRIASRDYVPTADGALNNTIAEVIGNKTDTGTSGDSIVALVKKNNTDILVIDGLHDVPTQDLATNATMNQVIGNKSDGKNGTSLYSQSAIILSQLAATKSQGAFTYIDAGGEVDIIELTVTTGEIIEGIWIDLVNMTQNGTIKLYYKIDGANYRQVSVGGTVQTYAYTVADGVDGVFIPGPFAIASGFKVSYEEGADEGANREIPYNVIRRQFVIS